MRLDKILENIDTLNIYGDTNINIDNIYYDSREVTKNSLFICIKGYNTNGHLYIENAIKSGAKAFLIEEDINIDNMDKYTFIKVSNTKEAMAKIASNFYNEPSTKLDVIGITGTNGKTSVSTLLKEILNKVDKCGLIGTIEIDNSNEKIIPKNTTPESLDLQKNFNDMLKNNCKYCAMEVSSHALSLGRVKDTSFLIGLFTNLTEEHLDFHKNIVDYRNSKEKLFYMTRKANVINIDDEHGKIILNNIKNLDIPVYTYAINENSDFMASDIILEKDHIEYKLKTPTYEDHIYVNIPGKFSVYNTLGIISICYILDIDINIVKEVFKNTKGIKGRFESIKNNKKLNVIVDYAHTPDALENILKASKEFTKGKVITVFGCGGDRDRQKRPIMGKIAQEYSDIAIITSDNPRCEDPHKIINDILKGINIKKDNYIIIEDRKEAIYKAIDIANDKDLVIIAGKGHEDYQIIGKKKHPFDDTKVALEAINLK